MDKKSKIAVCSICYNEADIIGACIKNWKGKVDKHLVLVSSQPWNGSPREADNTVGIARELGAEVIVGYWENEPTMRNWGLARLYDYDYVLIVDPDELYLPDDIEKIIAKLNNPYDYINRVMKPQACFRAGKMLTYWKTSDYIFDPPDAHKPFIAVDPKQVRFWNKRELMGIGREPVNIEYAEPIDCIIHHMSWVKSDEKALEKIETYSHINDIPLDWYDNVWKKWTPGSDIYVRPYGNILKEQSKTIYSPAPEHIKGLMAI